ncbi:MAG: hypothetical protein M3005_02610 [Apilactobacillus sp.]|uniref:hypothetical protein n=1 Tax=Apilactobacillus TaxID=2767877 RepID=UPI0025EEA150|nr:hypothetical protein [Apilactobacillus sp.]MCT6822744.1 hypothetical protein [Apilactobacillus sp.]MCT6858218.1 hypothetical protein [Apilactobacillus sp.]
MEHKNSKRIKNMIILGLSTGIIFELIDIFIKAFFISKDVLDIYQTIFFASAIILALFIFYESCKKFYPLTDKQYQISLIVFESGLFLGYLIDRLISAIFNL